MEKEVIMISVRAGENFHDVAEKAKQAILDKNINDPELKAINNYVVQYRFNGINCVVSVATNVKNLYRDYVNAHLMGWEIIGPNCFEYSSALAKQIVDKKAAADKEAAIENEKYRNEAKRSQRAFKAKIEGIELEVIDTEFLKKQLELNSTDPYSARCVSYAQEWGCAMQKEITDRNIKEVTPEALSDFADQSSREADYDGITGFMYGAAVQILAACWKHGESLRKWHNKEYGHVGSGVINPAVMTIETTNEEK